MFASTPRLPYAGTMTTTHNFSTEAAVDMHVAHYRHAMAELESALDEPGSQEWLSVCDRLRQQWAEWQGEDSLHEMAYGEPDE
jgi:hypothetical protein